MKTEIIFYTRPNNGSLSQEIPLEEVSPEWSQRGVAYTSTGNPNQNNLNLPITNAASGVGRKLDLYEDVDIPLNFSIIDVRDPDKRKTSWSKTIKVPGTKNNNRIFQHIYQISGDGWVTIGNTSVYQNFNPSLRREVIVNSDGVQVMKGNLQLKGIRKDSVGRIEYDIILSGDLTSLFFDVGEAKLSDLDLTEWNHEWSKNSVERSWEGRVYKNGVLTDNMTTTPDISISRVEPQITSLGFTNNTNRCVITSPSVTGYRVGDFISFQLDSSSYYNGLPLPYGSMNGTWVVTEVLSLYKFVINHQYPGALRAVGYNIPIDIIALCRKSTSLGKGYVYPLISWGDEFDSNSWPVSAMTPAYYAKELLDKIFKKTGSTYDSNFLNSELFRRLIVTQKKTSYELTTSELDSRKFNASSPTGYVIQATKSLLPNSYPTLGVTISATASWPFNGEGAPLTQTKTKFPFYVENADGSQSPTSLGNWNNDTWYVKDNGEYDINVKASLSTWIDINGIQGGPLNGTASIVYDTNAFNGGDPARRFRPSGSSLVIAMEIWVKRAGQEIMISNVQSTFTNTTTNYLYDAYSVIPGANSYVNGWENNYRLGKGRYQPTAWLSTPFNIDKKSQFLKAGDEVYVLVYQKSLNSTPSDVAGYSYLFTQLNYYNAIQVRGKWNWSINQNATISNVPSPIATEGSIILGTDFLPKEMTCREFLRNIFKMFNLHIESDKFIDKKYFIEPRDDYYYTGSNGITDYVDWTKKMDPDSVEIVPLGELLSKYYTFSNRTETDYWNKRFKDERGRDYQYYKKEIVNDFLKNETKIEISFGSTVMINNPEDSDVVMPSIIQKQDEVAKPSTNSAPRILIWVGYKPFSQGRGLAIRPLNPGSNIGGKLGWELLSSAAVTPTSASSSSYPFYPYAGTNDSPEDPFYDINWYNLEANDFVYWNYARFTNNNLYNKYWSNFIDEVSDPSSMVVTANFNLTPKDIYNLDFRKIYVIDGVYYRLQKIIDYSPVIDNKRTKVELLKLITHTKFTAKSVISGGTFTTSTDTVRPIPLEYLSLAPKTKGIRDGGFTNILPVSSNATISVRGQGNYVSDSRSVSVYGNECYIGSGSQNINIQGNGVFVHGGLINVSVIGTDKVVIDESNVSYINGVRYKNGVAISRSSVVDAGEVGTASVYLTNKSNKTVAIDLVDAGEDVVITPSSSTHEDVINAGSDRILPNLAELGLTTMNTPNPKTNSSGGYNQDLGTLTLAQSIRTTPT